eukprot:GHVN01041085.1.p1 GENE.GHVN01041085.1~~GHVN01041085.1.p1  ORF type:complete len:193 (+),score=31.88 GHVN01041085.1:46-624(+)
MGPAKTSHSQSPTKPEKERSSPKVHHTYSQNLANANPVTVYSYAPSHGYATPTGGVTQSVRLAPQSSQPVGYAYPSQTFAIPPAVQASLAPRQQVHGAHDNLRKVLDDNEALEVRAERLQREVTELRSQSENLTAQVNALTNENGELREELGYYERARNHPLMGEAVRSLTRNANTPVEQPNNAKQTWCWSR